MQFRVEGIMDVVAPVAERKDGFLKEETFSVEVVADSEDEALRRAHWKLQMERFVDSPRNFRSENVQPVSHMELGELGRWVFEEVVRKWLKENYPLESHGFKPDVLSKPELIPPAQGGGLPKVRYIDPETGVYFRDPQLNFPQKITPLILRVVKDKREAKAAIDLIFERVSVAEEKEGDGDHHSMTYGEEVIPVYYIRTEEALSLAKNPEELRQLIDKKLAGTPK